MTLTEKNYIIYLSSFVLESKYIIKYVFYIERNISTESENVVSTFLSRFGEEIENGGKVWNFLRPKYVLYLFLKF